MQFLPWMREARAAGSPNCKTACDVSPLAAPRVRPRTCSLHQYAPEHEVSTQWAGLCPQRLLVGNGCDPGAVKELEGRWSSTE